ncbi:MAG: tetratricopeptide repeat protein [Pseudomonadota bacterium]|nr:tetratricopeptide repeat protein [Pseudomonadota bacterium]
MKAIVKQILSIGLVSSSLLLAACDRSPKQPDFDQTLFEAQSYLLSGQIQSALIESQNLLRMQPDSMEAKRLLSDTFYTAGDYKSAKKNYKEILVKMDPNAPEYPGLFSKYIETLTHLGQSKEAIANLDQYSKSYTVTSDINRLYGDAALVSNNFEKATEYFSKSLDQNPQNSESLLGMALANNALGQSEKAVDWLNQAIESKTDFADALIFQGYFYISQKQPDLAEASFSQAIAALGKYDIMTSQRYRAIHGLSKAYVDQGRTEEALRLNKTLADSPQGKIQQSLKSALEAYEQGDSGLAGEYFEEVLSISPDNQLSNLGLGMIKLKQGDIETAEHLLSQASKSLEGLNEETIKALALARLRLSKYEAAEDLLTKGLKKYPDSQDLKVLMASVMTNKGQFDDAEAKLKEVLAKDANEPDAMNLLAYIYQDRGDIKKAQDLYVKSIKVRPDFLPSYQGLISSYPRSPEAAQQQIQQILSQQSKPVIATEVALAITHILNKDMAAARDLSKKLYEKAPRNLYVQKVLSFSLYASALNDFKRKRFQPAYIQLKEAMDIMPTPQMATLFTRLAVELQRPDEAVQILKKLVDKEPNFTVGQELLGDLELSNGHNDKALTYFNQAWEQQPSFRLALKVFKLKQATGTFEESIAHVQTWYKNVLADFKTQSNTPEQQRRTAVELEASLFALTTIYEQNNHPTQAIEYYESLLKLQPNSPVYLNNIAWLKFNQNQSDAADYAAKAYKLAPETGEIIDTYAWILVQTGERDKGIKLLQLAAEKSPDNPVIKKHLEEATAMKSKSI